MIFCRPLWIVTLAAVALISPTISGAQPVLRLDGSTGGMPLVAALAKAHATKPGAASPDIGKGLGTRARIEALQAGRIDIAVASHGLKPEELERQGFAVHEIARAAVVFGVNAGVPLTNVSSADVCAIFAGKANNWKQVGGPDLSIEARTRPDSEVDAEVVRDQIACLKTLKMPDSVRVMQRGGDMSRELAATPGSFGMTTATATEQSGGRIRALALDGVPPSEANVSNGSYRLVREVYLVVPRQPSPAVVAFLAFVGSAEGAAVIKANGAIPKAPR